MEQADLKKKRRSQCVNVPIEASGNKSTSPPLDFNYFLENLKQHYKKKKIILSTNKVQIKSESQNEVKKRYRSNHLSGSNWRRSHGNQG